MTIAEAIPVMVLSGDRPTQAAQRLGIFPVTFKAWIARGVSEIARMELEEREEPEPLEGPYVWVALGVMQAEAEWEHWAVECWQAKFGSDWHAAFALLKARLPDVFGDKAQVTLAGPGGGPIRVAAVASPSEIKAMLAQDEAASKARLAPVDVKEVVS